MVTDTNGVVWAMRDDNTVAGLRCLCKHVLIDIPENWAREKEAMELLGFVVFELDPIHAWVFERVGA
jgi:hypothetical protein